MNFQSVVAVAGLRVLQHPTPYQSDVLTKGIGGHTPQACMCVHNQIVYEIVTHAPTVSAVYLGIFSTECTEISIVT